MAMPSHVRDQRDFVLAELEKTNIENDKKLVYTNLLNHTALGCNGLTKDEKLQNATESIFQLVSLELLKVIRESRFKKADASKASIIAACVTCKWPITIALCVIAFLLSQQGELANILSRLL